MAIPSEEKGTLIDVQNASGWTVDLDSGTYDVVCWGIVRPGNGQRTVIPMIADGSQIRRAYSNEINSFGQAA